MDAGVITRTDRNQTFDAKGNLVAEEVVQTDITAPSVRYDLHDRARQALTANAAYLALAAPTNAQNTAQIRRLTRQVNALTRLAIALDGADDLLVESTDV